MKKRLEKLDGEKANKKDAENLKGEFDQALKGIDEQSKHLDDIKTEQLAFHPLFEVYKLM